MNTGAPPISLIEAAGCPQGETLADTWVGVRPEHVEISRTPRAAALQGHVADHLSLPPRKDDATHHPRRRGRGSRRDRGEAAPPIGAEVWLTFKRYHVFDKASGRRLSSHGG